MNQHTSKVFRPLLQLFSKYLLGENTKRLLRRRELVRRKGAPYLNNNGWLWFALTISIPDDVKGEVPYMLDGIFCVLLCCCNN